MASKASCGFAMVAWSAAALADTASKDLAVTATVVDSCAIKSPTDDEPVRITCNSIVSYALHQHIAPATRSDHTPDSDIVVITVTF